MSDEKRGPILAKTHPWNRGDVEEPATLLGVRSNVKGPGGFLA